MYMYRYWKPQTDYIRPTYLIKPDSSIYQQNGKLLYQPKSCSFLNIDFDQSESSNRQPQTSRTAFSISCSQGGITILHKNEVDRAAQGRKKEKPVGNLLDDVPNKTKAGFLNTGPQLRLVSFGIGSKNTTRDLKPINRETKCLVPQDGYHSFEKKKSLSFLRFFVRFLTFRQL